MVKKSLNQWQFGDFQTPIVLAKKIVNLLRDRHCLDPDVIIEPTCGKGGFIYAALDTFLDSKIIGFDINSDYIQDIYKHLGQDTERTLIQQGDFFQIDWNNILEKNNGKLLILGNPPWVTSSELSLLNSKNIPQKSNFQCRRGIEAITGSANFDISEWMILQYINWLSKHKGAIAVLCKTSVARKVIKQLFKSKNTSYSGHIYPINAQTYFNAAVEACLFILMKNNGTENCAVYDNLDTQNMVNCIGERNGYIVKNVKQYDSLKYLQGQELKYIWRTGLKHDCSKVMELEFCETGFKNGLGETIELENCYIYPLLKSSDLGNGKINSYRKVVLVTQNYVGEDTAKIKQFAPKTWDYLESHHFLLENRKSSVYKGKPAYSIFGVGDYTFKNWKIAISGLYKRLDFCLISPLNEKPVIFDDTVNFLSFDSQEEAKLIYELITSDLALSFLESMIFWDEKRPITTNILRRLSLNKLAQALGKFAEYNYFAQELAVEQNVQLKLPIS